MEGVPDPVPPDEQPRTSAASTVATDSVRLIKLLLPLGPIAATNHDILKLGAAKCNDREIVGETR
jgi:hypothetical protein